LAHQPGFGAHGNFTSKQICPSKAQMDGGDNEQLEQFHFRALARIKQHGRFARQSSEPRLSIGV
jgi:hypothetical protein